MPTITVPHQFFIDERKKLYNWKPDFWRELLQNSVDAGAKQIDIQLIESEEGQVCISVADNGCGMTREVLDKVYFALGETTKTGGGSIGGFGRARIMTCFGHDRYEIETLNNHVQGKGGEYLIDDIDNQPGCLIKVWMSDTSSTEMKNILINYLQTCSLDRYSITIKINNELYNNYLNRGRRVRELSFAGIYVNRSGSFCNTIIFRVLGLTMFSRYINCNKQIIVEIDPNRAREVLSANRNEFTGNFRNEASRWIDEVTVDNMSALRYQNRETRRIINGSGSLLMMSNLPKDTIEEDQKQGKSGLSLPAKVEGEFNHHRSAAFSNNHYDEYIEPMPGDRFSKDLFDVMILSEDTDPSMDKVVERFNPEKWTYEYKTEQGCQVLYRKGREAYRLLIAWKIAVEEALRILLDEYSISDTSWSVGWVFGWQEGCHLEVNGLHIFCLNPVEGTKTCFRLSKRQDLLKLIAIAKHEVAHCRVDVHNETWGNTLTNIDKQYDAQSVIRRIKKELAALDI